MQIMMMQSVKGMGFFLKDGFYKYTLTFIYGFNFDAGSILKGFWKIKFWVIAGEEW
jgi:hypothetical protein